MMSAQKFFDFGVRFSYTSTITYSGFKMYNRDNIQVPIKDGKCVYPFDAFLSEFDREYETQGAQKDKAQNRSTKFYRHGSGESV